MRFEARQGRNHRVRLPAWILRLGQDRTRGGPGRRVITSSAREDLARPVWDRLEPGLQQELDNRNPRPSDAERMSKHHTLLGDEATQKLRDHLLIVLALMRISNDRAIFMVHLRRACPKRQETIPFPFCVSSLIGFPQVIRHLHPEFFDTRTKFSNFLHLYPNIFWAWRRTKSRDFGIWATT